MRRSLTWPLDPGAPGARVAMWQRDRGRVDADASTGTVVVATRTHRVTAVPSSTVPDRWSGLVCDHPDCPTPEVLERYVRIAGAQPTLSVYDLVAMHLGLDTVPEFQPAGTLLLIGLADALDALLDGPEQPW